MIAYATSGYFVTHCCYSTVGYVILGIAKKIAILLINKRIAIVYIVRIS